MSIELTVRIDELLSLTEEMFSLASEGAWDAVEACEVQRLAIIGSWVQLEEDYNDGVAAKIKQLLARNSEIVTLANNEKDNVANELKLSRSLEKAEKAYRIVDAGR